MLRRRRILCCWFTIALLTCVGLATGVLAQEPASEPVPETAPQGVEESQEEVPPAAPAAAAADEGAADEGAAEEGAAEEGAAEEEPAAPIDAALSAVPTSVDDVRKGTGRAWNEFVLPLWQRFVSALPSVLKAIALLLLFWIVGLFLGWLTTAALRRTELDNRLARDLGLEKTVKSWEEKGTSLEHVVGTAVKWVVLLFGFVAFFNALDLEMVAGPLNNVLTQISSAVPALLKAFAYLAVYWAVGTLLRFGISKGLGAVGVDDRVERWVKPREVRGVMVGPSAMLGRLVFYVVLLFGLPPFLEALGQEAAVAPLRDMMSELFGFLPNVVAALILLFIARVVATIVREVVVNFLAAAGVDELAERFGLARVAGSRKLSEIIGALAFFFTLIPILVAAVDSLQIEAISRPVEQTLQQLLAAVPLIFVAVVVILVGYFIAQTVKGLVEGFLKGVGFDSLPARLNLGFLATKEGGASLSTIVASFVMVVILLLVVQQALATVQLEQLAELIGGLLAYLPRLLAGLAIILAALSLGTYVHGLLAALLQSSMQGAILSRGAQYAIYFLGFSMGLAQLGVAEEIITVAVTAVLGGTALALALAFGLGGRDNAKQFLDRHRIGGSAG